MHEEIDQSAVDETGQDGAVNQERELAAGEVVYRRSAERDEEVQDDSQRRGSSAAAVRLYAKETAGDCLRDENGLLGAINQDRVDQVEHTNDKAADNDGRERPCFCAERGWKTTSRSICHQDPPLPAFVHRTACLFSFAIRATGVKGRPH